MSCVSYAKVCCSIEMEPRTLNQGRLTHAREVAAAVAQKMEPKDASAIFIKAICFETEIKGLISAVVMKVVDEQEQTDEEMEVGSVESEKHVDEYNHQKAQIPVEIACQRSCNNIDSPETNNLKELVTAAF